MWLNEDTASSKCLKQDHIGVFEKRKGSLYDQSKKSVKEGGVENKVGVPNIVHIMLYLIGQAKGSGISDVMENCWMILNERMAWSHLRFKRVMPADR